jgi:hypothetical protein
MIDVNQRSASRYGMHLPPLGGCISSYLLWSHKGGGDSENAEGKLVRIYRLRWEKHREETTARSPGRKCRITSVSARSARPLRAAQAGCSLPQKAGVRR